MTALLTTAVYADAEVNRPDGDRLWISAPYVMKSRLDRLRARWDAQNRMFWLPLTWANCIGLRTEIGADLTMSDDLRTWATQYQYYARPLRDLRADHGRDVEMSILRESLPGFASLFAHQRSGIDLILRSQWLNRWRGTGGARYLVLDQTGVGKTRVALGALALLEDTAPVVVLCPKSMIRTWHEEALGFFPGADIREVHGTAVQRRKALVPGAFMYIMGYESVRAHSRITGYAGAAALTDEQRQDKEIQQLGVQTLIVDEAHRCASPKTLQTRAAWTVADQARNVIAMTGTPLQESPEDLWAVLRMIDRYTFPTMSGFRDRYLDMVINPFGGWDVRGLKQTTQHEFFDLFHTMSRRAEKAEVLPFLPPKVHEIRWVELPAPLRRAYKQMADQYLLEVASGEVTVADNAMVVAGRLIQLANATLDVHQKDDGTEVVRMITPSPKVDAFMADIAGGDFDGTSVVVFSDSKQLLDLLGEAMASKGIDFVTITGDDSAADRHAAIERFQSGSVQYILISRAGDTGITLTKASVMVRLTRSWSYVVHTQAEDRVHRIGSEQHDSITYIDYVTESTVEEGQLVRLNSKKEKATAVLHPDELKDMLR